MPEYQILYRKNEQDRLLKWWRALDGNRGERAQLRRAESADDVLLTVAFARFLKIVDRSEAYQLFDNAMLAGLLSRVEKDDDSHSFAEALAKPKAGGSKAAMSELRFRQLQKSQDVDEFFRRMTRAISLLCGTVNVLSLADGILHWLKEHRQSVDQNPQKRLAVRWASDYYSNLKD